jgi:D-alanine-D-alanine ligase
MNVALILNTRRDESEFQAEYDPIHTVELIRGGIERAGHSCRIIEGDETAFEALRRDPPDLVFNRAEGVRGESRESHIPSMLEMLGIPYVGSGVLTLALCLNKGWTKVFVEHAGAVTPSFELVSSAADLAASRPTFPVILKPNSEGSSIGINEDNVVSDITAYRKKAESMLERYHEAILVEQFIPGREVSVGVLGDGRGGFEVLPTIEVDFSQLPDDVGNVFGQRAKIEYDDLSHYLCPAPIDANTLDEISKATLTMCRALDIRDFARFDFRIDATGRIYFLEVNPLPGMDYDPAERDFSFYVLMALASGLSYDGLIARLLASARSRYSMR